MLEIFKKTFKGLEKTRKKVSNVFSKISKKTYLDEDDIALLEDCLSQADISYRIIEDVLDAVRDKDSSDSTWRDRARRVLLSKVQIDQIVMPEIETIKEDERNFSESVTTSFEDLNWRLDGKHLIDIQQKYSYGIFIGDPDQGESYNLSIDALQAAPDGTFIVAGVGGRIARFNGSSWSSLNSPTTDDILALGVTGDAWVVVTVNKQVFFLW